MTKYAPPLLELNGLVNTDDPDNPWIQAGHIVMEIDTGATGKPKHTAIVVPNTVTSAPMIDVILYFHGIQAPRISDYVRLRKFRAIIEATGRRVVLVAPTLGPKSEFGLLGQGTTLRAYIATVLGALASYGPFVSPPKLNNLILAAHSGGGRALIAAAEELDGAPDLKVREAWGFDCMYGEGTPVTAPEPFKVAEPGHPVAKSLDDWKTRTAGSLEARWKSWASANHVFRVYFGAGGTKTRTANLDLMDQLDPAGLGVIMQPRFYRMENDGSLIRLKPEPGPVAAHDLVPQTALGPAITSCPWLK